ncbi:23S rRNA pseudouridine(1911/1915/1917) synthase RluD [Litoribacillus peritrichatus]|uniref:Pseudouridine synthase n=1 Tax=Litoribacillus peritrichatus TaxID=718191 RepID=A0ABP7NBA4_9GAMM
MSRQISESQTVPEDMSGMRVDQIASKLFSEYSRVRLQGWIKSGELTIDGKTLKPKEKLWGGELLEIEAELEDVNQWQAENIPLEIVYEDDDILVINKPVGLVVHPAAGHYNGTLLNALLYHYPGIEVVPRAGIVHRLDMDTSGLMVVAKTIEAQTDLVDQLQTREMGREYEAVVQGVMTGGGVVDEPIGRHPVSRMKQAVIASGKPAITHYRVMDRYQNHTHIRLKLETGRTHQIRVHMSHLGYPLIGDAVYAGRMRIPKGASPALLNMLQSFKRQALHAKRLELVHPITGEDMAWEVELPQDMVELLACLAEEDN